MSKLYFVVFIAIVLSVYTAMHGFIYWRLVSGLSLTSGQRLALKLLLVAGALTFIAAEFLSRLTSAYPLLYAGSLWLGVLAIALAVFLLELAFSLLFPQQRRLLVLAALALVFIISAISVLNVALGPVLRQVKIPVRGLAADLEGFTIVQLSDLHLGNLTSARQLRRVVDRVNALKPDLICVTGDALDGNICRDEDYCKILSDLQARHGVVAVTGNHEFYAGIDKFLELARRSNWRVLRNQSWIIEGRIAVIGLEEDSATRFKLPGPDLEAALRHLPTGIPKILLYHRPAKFAEAVQRGVDLQLSGHTHAGQIPPMDLLVWLIYKYPAGLYRLGQSYIYTSPGTGTWGPPMRFLSRSQIVELVLVR
ncbi:MAG: metallophosphoesterase [Candidatus Aminicenantes bacterium]|nr:metallophosphoesterase [Candidatus Aminicenantes bacterium]